MLLCVVVYNKKISDLPIFQYPIKQKLDLFIYDNSKLPQEILNFENFNIYYEHDKNNSGVSRAYNRAAIKANELGKNLLLLLDQDSDFKLSFIDAYFLSYQKYGNQFLYAPVVIDPDGLKIYSPAYLKCFVGKVQIKNDFMYKQVYNLQGKSVINSGLMVPLSLFEKIGGYNENLKLDFSDIYFIEKYKALNSKIILVNVELKHSISGDEGMNFHREFLRFKYYCSAARETGRALNTFIFWSPFRRFLRLTLKYRSLKFIKVFFDYYLRGKQV